MSNKSSSASSSSAALHSITEWSQFLQYVEECKYSDSEHIADVVNTVKKLENSTLADAPVDNIVQTLRATYQKWSSKITANSSDKKSFALYGLLLSDITFRLLTTHTHTKAVTDKDLMDKYIKVMSFTLANSYKLIIDIHSNSDSDSNSSCNSGNAAISVAVSMLTAGNFFLMSKILPMHHRKKALFISSDNVMPKCFIYYMQAVSQTLIKYRGEKGIPVATLLHLSQTLNDMTCDCDVRCIVRSSLTPEQYVPLITHTLDSLWATLIKIDVTIATSSSNNDVDKMNDELKQKVISTYTSHLQSDRIAYGKVFESSTSHFLQLVKCNAYNKASDLVVLLSTMIGDINMHCNNTSSSSCSNLIDVNECKRIYLWLLECTYKMTSQSFSAAAVSSTSSAWQQLLHLIDLVLIPQINTHGNAACKSTDITASHTVILEMIKIILSIELSSSDEEVVSNFEKLLSLLQLYEVDVDDTASIEILAKLHIPVAHHECRKKSTCDRLFSVKLWEMTNQKFESVALKAMCSNSAKKQQWYSKSSNAIARSMIACTGSLQSMLLCDVSHGYFCIQLTAANLRILSSQLWQENAPSLLASLRSIGNCTNHIPYADFIGAHNICTSLGGLISMKIFDSSTLTKDFTCVQFSLASLIATKCMQAGSNYIHVSALIQTLFTSNDNVSIKAVDVEVVTKLLQILSTCFCKATTLNKEEGLALLHTYINFLQSAPAVVVEEFLCLLLADMVARLNDVRSDNEQLLELMDRVYELLDDTNSVGNVVLTDKEKQIILLYVSSHSVWLQGKGVSDSTSTYIIDRLKGIASQVDCNTISIISRGNKNSKRSGSTASVGTPPLSSWTVNSRSTSALCLRLWVLLAQWAFPAINTSKLDVCESDGDHGISMYLTHATKAVKAVATSSDDLSNLWLQQFVADVKTLYHMLGLHGRLDDQCKVTQYIGNTAATCTAAHACNSSVSMTELKSVYEELAVLHLIQSTCNVITTKDTASSCLSTVVTGADCTSQSWCAALSSYITSLSNTLTSTSATQTSIAEFERTAESMYQLIPGSSSSSSSKRSSSINAIRSWYCLFVAKMALFTLDAHTKAVAWSKRSLGASSSFIDSYYGPGYTLDTALPRLEAVLFMAEVYEEAGKLDSALAYVSESMAIMKVGSRALSSIVSLHCMRIWYRMQSGRFSSALNELQQNNDESAVDGVYDVVSKHARLSATCMAALLRINGDGDNASDDAIPTSVESMRFRHIGRSWDVSGIMSGDGALYESLSPRVFGSYSTAMTTGLRAVVRDILTPNDSIRVHADASLVYTAMSPGSATDTKVSIDADVSKIMTKLSDSLCFDVIRDVRRRCCLNIVRDTSKHCSDLSLLHAWLLGATSCSTAIDHMVVDAAIEKANAVGNSNSDASILHPFDVVKKSCCGDIPSLRSLSYHMEQSLDKHHKMHKTDITVCFITLEASTNSLIIGRYSRTASHPSIVSLPIGTELKQIIDYWHTLMAKGKGLLQKTMDVEKVQKWSDEDKRQWWHERKVFDSDIASIMNRLQLLLSHWKLLLLPTPIKANAVGNSIHTDDSVDALVENMSTMNLLNTANSSSGSGVRKKKMHPSAAAVVSPSVLGFLSQLVDTNADSMTDAVKIIRDIIQCGGSSNSSSSSTAAIESDAAKLLEAYMSDHSSLSNSRNSGSVSAADKKNAKATLQTLHKLDTGSYSGMKVVELRQQLQSLPGALSTKGTKAELISRLLEATSARTAHIDINKCSSSKSVDTNISDEDDDMSHLVLILDENIQSLPWESLPCLRNVSCSRVPSMNLLLNILNASDAVGTSSSGCSNGGSSLSIEKVWYAIDPEGNLPSTRATMETFLQPYTNQWMWAGYVNMIPATASVISHHNDNDLFIYCGHGAGERLLDSRSLKKCKCPASLLWGCSSGKLTVHGVHDPMGAAANYLIGGASFVLGNLWDVTDKDIDRLSIQCMSTFLDSVKSTDRSSVSISNALITSRDSCKLIHAVGCAPVIYGVPVHVR